MVDCLLMRYYFIYILIFLQSICLILKAESSDSLSLNYPYINYTTKDGLPSNETYCILQDSKGYIWIGTDRGLVKYDGYEFKTYTTLDGLRNNGIVALFEDKVGKIWYSTLNATIGYIDSKLNVFGEYKYQSKVDSILVEKGRSEIHFNEIILDDTNNMYLLHSKIGIIEIDDNGSLEYTLDETNDLDIEIYKIEDEYKVFRNRYTGDKNVNYNLFLENQLIFSSNIEGYLKVSDPQIVYQNDTLYVYDKQFFIKLSPEGEVYESKSFNSNINLNKVGDVFLYNILNNEIAGIEGEVYVSKSPLIDSPKRKMLDGIYISNVFEDSNNGIWISTLKNGVYYYPSLKHLTSNKTSINGILPVDSGNVIINSKRFTNHLYNPTDNSIESAPPIHVKHINFNKIFNKHLIFNDLVKVQGLEIVKNMNPHKTRSFSVSGVQAIDDSSYHYWQAQVIYKKKNNEVKYKWMPDYDMKRLESYYYINDSLSLFGSQSGLYINTRDTVLINTINRSFSSDPRVENLIYLKESLGIVCSVLGEGIYILDKSYNVLHHITIDHGLVSNTINQLYVDQDSIIWVGTNNGINTLEINENSYVLKKILGSSLILTSPNITQLYKEDSLLYVGTDQGLAIINIKEISVVKELPLRITDVKISDQYYDRININQLEYDQNDFEIQYIGLSYNRYGRLNYRYRLLGLSKDWIYTKERKAIFLQLQPKQYVFELEVQNEYGDWVAIDTSLKFTINKPYWRTWWFIGIVILLGILIIGGILYYYITNLNKEKIFIEDKQRLSEELNETQQKALSSQLNPHFVFNSLNSIQNFILTKRTELSSDYLSMFSKLMRFVFENSKKLYVPLQDEIEAIHLYLELEQVRHNHSFNFIVRTSEIEMDTIFIPSLLIQPIIENAIWHGLLHKKSEDRLLEIKFYVDDMSLHIDVKDNGVGRGFSKPRPKFIKKQRSSGVQLTKQRLELLSQSSNLDTNFKIIDLSDKIGRPCGTCVTISIPLTLNSIDK